MKKLTIMLEDELLTPGLDPVPRGLQRQFPIGISYVLRTRTFRLLVTGLISASSLCLMSVTTHATVIAGTGLPPVGASDVTVTYNVNNTFQRPAANFIKGSTLAGGDDTGTVANTGGYSAAATMNFAPVAGVANVSWAISLTEGSSYYSISWNWSPSGIGGKGPFNIPDVKVGGSYSQTAVTISLPVGVPSIAVTGFGLYGNQNPNTGDNLLTFQDFSTTPLHGNAGVGYSYRVCTRRELSIHHFFRTRLSGSCHVSGYGDGMVGKSRRPIQRAWLGIGGPRIFLHPLPARPRRPQSAGLRLAVAKSVF